jgi:ATP-dependent Clp protease ATP-binding subunit ClpA
VKQGTKQRTKEETVFERFTRDARTAVVLAQSLARDLGAERIGTEHLLLGCALGPPDRVAPRALAAQGVTGERLLAQVRSHPGASGLDAEALASLGIDLDAVRASADAVFGPGALDGRPRRGHLRFTPAARKAMQVSLREAVHGGQREIDSGHVLVALLRVPESTGHDVLRRCGVDAEGLRAAVRSARQGEAA